MMRHRSAWRAITASGALLLASCGGGTDDGAVDEVPATTTTAEDIGDADTPATTAEPAPESAPIIFEVIETEPNEPGPRPELSWSAVDGAVTYDLIVLDSGGSAYWGWSGETTSIHLGGVSNPDAIGAWVFEPLTWIVTARDSAGQTVAVSLRATLEP